MPNKKFIEYTALDIVWSHSFYRQLCFILLYKILCNKLYHFVLSVRAEHVLISVQPEGAISRVPVVLNEKIFCVLLFNLETRESVL